MTPSQIDRALELAERLAYALELQAVAALLAVNPPEGTGTRNRVWSRAMTLADNITGGSVREGA